MRPPNSLVISGCLVVCAMAMSVPGRAAQESIINTGFRCENGTVFAATFDNDASALTLDFPEGPSVRLNQAVSGSGIRYEGDGIEFLGKGRSATVLRPGQPNLRCEEDEGAAKKPTASGGAQ